MCLIDTYNQKNIVIILRILKKIHVRQCELESVVLTLDTLYRRFIAYVYVMLAIRFPLLNSFICK